MPADRLTLYYSGTDPTGNRLDNAQAASIGGNSQYNCDLVRNEGCQFAPAPGRTGKGFRAGDLNAQQFRPGAPLTTVAISRSTINQARQDSHIVHDFVDSRPLGKQWMVGASVAGGWLEM